MSFIIHENRKNWKLQELRLENIYFYEISKLFSRNAIIQDVQDSYTSSVTHRKSQKLVQIFWIFKK